MKKVTTMTESELEIYADMEKMEARITKEIGDKTKYLIDRLDSIETGTGKLNPQLTIILEQIKINHEREMKKMDMEMFKMTQELQMKVAEFQDAQNIKRRDSEDKQLLKVEGLKAISDIATAVTAAMTANAKKRPFWKFWR